jgi:hypothetical protein
MKIMLFTNARDESHLKEWAAHHLLLGFDNIIIFDHKSVTPISTEFMGFDSRIKVIRVEMTGSIKMQLMKRAATIARASNADWMLYLDADEFLILNKTIAKYPGIKAWLSAFTAQCPPSAQINQIAVNWLMYGTNGRIEELNLQKGELILNTFTKSDEILNNHVKCFVKPTAIKDAANPHYFVSKGMTVGVNGHPFVPPFHNWNIPFYMAPIYIAHYVFQSEKTYRKRKLNLPRDDNGTMRIDSDIQNIHRQFNTRENLLAKRLYGEKVGAFLQHHK